MLANILKKMTIARFLLIVIIGFFLINLGNNYIKLKKTNKKKLLLQNQLHQQQEELSTLLLKNEELADCGDHTDLIARYDFGLRKNDEHFYSK